MMVQPWEILLAYFVHLVNVDALGVDVLGPRLAVEGCHRLKISNCKKDFFCRMLNPSFEQDRSVHLLVA